MINLHRGDIGWIVLWAYVIAWTCTSRDGETLSEAADRYLNNHRSRWLTEAALLTCYLHLSNRVPDKYDLWHQGMLGTQKAYRKIRNDA